jgi:hypothetical protein
MRQLLTARLPLGCLLVIGATLQVPTPPSPQAAEAAAIASGWTALGQGDPARAVAVANGTLAANPRSRGAVVLLVSAEIARGGAAAGLGAYESWLGARRLDDAYTLRSIALVLLQEAARDEKAPDARREAFRALSAEGDVQTLTQLAARAPTGALVETQLLAELGDKDAVNRLIAQLRTAPGYKTNIIQALMASRSRLAIPPLIELLKDGKADYRAAAADALGKLDATEAVNQLRPLLDDENYYVHFCAAAALFRLQDMSGLAFLREAAGSEHPMVRAQALQAMAVNPDAAWHTSVESLLHDPDPQVRLLAAQLDAPYAPDDARRVLEGLLGDNNLAIREVAGQTYLDQVATDFGTLRRFLHAAEPVTRVRAAGRILTLTR